MRDSFSKVLGLPSLIAVAIGVVVAQATLVTVLQGAGEGSYGFFLAMLLAFVFCLCAVLTFAELALMLPRAGSISSFTEVAMGHFPAIVATLSGYVVVNILAAPAELTLFGLVMQQVFFDSLPPVWIAVVLLSVLTVLNLVGLDLFAKFQTIFSVLMVITLLGIGIAGFMIEPSSPVDNPANPLGMHVLTLVALALWAFVGAEFVCAFVEETKNPVRNVPMAMLLGLTLTLGVYAVFFFGITNAVSINGLSSEALPHLFAAETILGKVGLYWIGFAAITATCSTINTLLGTISRMLYGMAHAGQVPKVFLYLHPRFKTPWVAILTLYGLILIPLFWANGGSDKILGLLIAASLAWLIAYMIAHLDLVVLRLRFPNLKRPFASPLFPIPQIIGVLGIAYVIWNIYPDPEVRLEIYRNAGFLLLPTCLYAFLWVVFKMKRKPFEPVPIDEALKE